MDRGALKEANKSNGQRVYRPESHEGIIGPSEVPVDAEYAIQENQERQFHEVQPNGIDDSLGVDILIRRHVSLLTTSRPMAELTFRYGTNHVFGTSQI